MHRDGVHSGHTLAMDFGGPIKLEYKQEIPNYFRPAKSRLSKITSINKIFTSSKFYKFRNSFQKECFCTS